jgi:hypothetical protein
MTGGKTELIGRGHEALKAGQCLGRAIAPQPLLEQGVEWPFEGESQHQYQGQVQGELHVHAR